MEIVITIGIFALAAYFLYRSTKKKAKGDCDCGSCHSHCPLYEERKKSDE